MSLSLSLTLRGEWRSSLVKICEGKAFQAAGNSKEEGASLMYLKKARQIRPV